MKPTDFAYALKDLTDGFGLPPLTEPRARALFEEYGSHPAEIVKRAIHTMLQGDRYPTSTQMLAAFNAARLWDHEHRRKEWIARRGKPATPGAVFDKLAQGPSLAAHPMVPQFCRQALELYSSGATPADLARFYRKMADEKPLAFMRLHDEADAVEQYGDAFPPGAQIFPLADRKRPAAQVDTAKQEEAAIMAQRPVQEDLPW